MAIIRICDWTKEVLINKEDIFIIEIQGNEIHKFEVGLEGRRLLLRQLEGENEPEQPEIQVVEKIDTPPETLQADPPGIDIETSEDPFDTEPGSILQPVIGADENETPVDDDNVSPIETPVGDDEVPPIEIPEGHKRIRTTPAQRDKVIKQSRRFEAGTLPSLTTGARAQKEASAKLLSDKNRDTEQLNRLGGHGIKLKDLNE